MTRSAKKSSSIRARPSDRPDSGPVAGPRPAGRNRRPLRRCERRRRGRDRRNRRAVTRPKPSAEPSAKLPVVQVRRSSLPAAGAGAAPRAAAALGAREARARPPSRCASIRSATSSCAWPARSAAARRSSSSPTRSTSCSGACPNSTPWPKRPNARGNVNVQAAPLRLRRFARRARIDDRRLRDVADKAASPASAARRTARSVSRPAPWPRSTPTISPARSTSPSARSKRRRATPVSARLLGNAYFAGGRFASAEAAYKDSLSLYSEPAAGRPEAGAGRRSRQGKNDEALSPCSKPAATCSIPPTTAWRWRLPAVPADAIPVLEPAARAAGADARVRQNLALAYALPATGPRRGRRRQDVPADQLDARIQQWMQLAKPAKASRPGRGADRRDAGRASIRASRSGSRCASRTRAWPRQLLLPQLHLQSQWLRSPQVAQVVPLRQPQVAETISLRSRICRSRLRRRLQIGAGARAR